MRKIIAITLALAFLSLSAIAQVKVAPMNIKQRTLPNGLKVVSMQDNSSPTIAIHVWYNVGGKNDPQGKSGFAHMFEHLMFKSTKNMKGEALQAFSATLSLSRKDFGLEWNVALESGGWLVSDLVKISLEVEVLESASVAA